jgi:hypothetical protein
LFPSGFDIVFWLSGGIFRSDQFESREKTACPGKKRAASAKAGQIGFV